MKEKVSAAERVREIGRKTLKKNSADERVRIVLEGLGGTESVAALCRHEPVFPVEQGVPRSRPEAPGRRVLSCRWLPGETVI